VSREKYPRDDSSKLHELRPKCIYLGCGILSCYTSFLIPCICRGGGSDPELSMQTYLSCPHVEAIVKLGGGKWKGNTDWWGE